MKEEGFAPILIVVLIAVVLGGYLIYSGKINLNKPQSAINQTTNTTESSKKAPSPEEIHSFPIFPGAKFVEKKETPPCNGNPAYYTCSSTIYSWTSDQADKVYDYYQNDPDNTGWKMTGGGGEFTNKQNYGINSGLRIGGKFYPFTLTAQNNYVQFNLAIPNK